MARASARFAGARLRGGGGALERARARAAAAPLPPASSGAAGAGPSVATPGGMAVDDDDDAAGELRTPAAAGVAALRDVAAHDGAASPARAREPREDVGDQAAGDAAGAAVAAAAAGLAALSPLSLTRAELTPGKRKRGPTAAGDTAPAYKAQPVGRQAPRTLVSDALRASEVRHAFVRRARAPRAAPPPLHADADDTPSIPPHCPAQAPADVAWVARMDATASGKELAPKTVKEYWTIVFNFFGWLDITLTDAQRAVYDADVVRHKSISIRAAEDHFIWLNATGKPGSQFKKILTCLNWAAKVRCVRTQVRKCLGGCRG
jgi:hypothetical protein